MFLVTSYNSLTDMVSVLDTCDGVTEDYKSSQLMGMLHGTDIKVHGYKNGSFAPMSLEQFIAAFEAKEKLLRGLGYDIKLIRRANTEQGVYITASRIEGIEQLEEFAIPDCIDIVNAVNLYSFDSSSPEIKLRSIRIPKTCEDIGCLADLSSIHKRYVEDLGNYCQMHFDHFVFFDEDTNEFDISLYDWNNNRIEDLVIPEGVQYIAAERFVCHRIRRVCFPSSLVSIDSCAFWGCRGLTEVKFHSNSRVSVDSKSFYDNPRLVKVQNFDKLNKVSSDAFSRTGIREIRLSKTQVQLSETRINDFEHSLIDAFKYCRSLRTIYVPRGTNIKPMMYRFKALETNPAWHNMGSVRFKFY